MSGGLRVAVGGMAAVYCVHDRVKRAIVSDAQLVALLAHAGETFDARQHRIHRCACCDNLFVDPTDEPRYCWTCRMPPSFALGGPLATPTGPTDG